MAGARPGGRRTSLLVAAVIAGAEATLLLVFARGASSTVALGGHVLVLVGIAVWAGHRSQRESQYAVLLWLATAAFGPLGPAGVMLAMALEWRYGRRATGIDEWHAMLFPPSHVDEQARLWRRIGQRASDLPATPQVTPFLDILAFGSVPQRQSVIAIIVQQFHPAFAPALKAALRDEHNVIRVQAATAIARLENESLERTMRLESALRESPEDAQAILALAAHYDDQAFAGLLDPTREQDCRERAAAGYGRYLERHPDDRAARFRLARLEQRRGRPAEAERLFRQLTDSGDRDARHWLMESLFAQKRYAELRRVAAVPADARESWAPEVAETLALWASEEVPA